MPVGIDVKFEVSKKLRDSGADIEQVMDELAPSIGRALGIAIKGRVMERGDLAGQAFPGYAEERFFKSDKGRAYRLPYYVSGRYPVPFPGQPSRSGAAIFKSSAEMHRAAGTRPGSYNVSGGMWSGLTLMALTPTLVRLLFRGRSEGQDPRFLNGKSRPIKVSNALKVWTVLEKHGVNVLQISEDELARMGNGTVQAIAASVEIDLPVEWSGQAPPHASTADILSAAINGR